MRHIDPIGHDTWASYAKAAREAAGLTKTELGGLIGVTRQTVGRWESGKFRPDKSADVYAFADATGVDRQEALLAAGIMPDAPPPVRPRRQEPPMDPDLKVIARRLADPCVSAREKIMIRAQLQYLARLADLDKTRDAGDEQAASA